MQEDFIYKKIDTARLTLDLIQAHDAMRLMEIRKYKDYKLYTGLAPFKNEEEAWDVIEQLRALVVTKQAYHWGIYDKESAILIGTICLWRLDFEKKSAELGYELHEDAHHQGYIAEALSGVIDFAFNKANLSLIRAVTHEDNHSSIEVLKKKSFQDHGCITTENNKTMRCYVLNKV